MIRICFCRFGVAPDHPEVKNVEHTFAKVAENPNVNFYGNVHLGKDVSLKELRDAYHVVLLVRRYFYKLLLVTVYLVIFYFI